MKKFSLIIFMLFFLNEAYSQNYYYYEGNRINLEQRTDKVAIILNSNLFEKKYLLNNLSSVTGISDKVSEIGENMYLVNFSETKSKSELDNFVTVISGRSNLIKFVTPVYYGDSKRVTQVPSDEFIVRMKSGKGKELLDIFNMKNNIKITGSVSDERGFLLKSNNGVNKNALELSETYLNSGLFEYAEPNFIYPEFCLLTFTPNDAHYTQQWSLNNTGQTVPTEEYFYGDQPTVNGIPGADMDVNLAWDYTTGSSLLKIGIIDTGIDSAHPDFQASGHLLAGYDACYNVNTVPRDSGNHGTGTAGLVGAVMNNSIGVAGIASGCKLISIRIYDALGNATVAGVVRAFDTARVRGIDVLSNSWGGGTVNSSLTNAINNAATNGRGGLGCVILFASGNDGRNPPIFPSVLPNVISVGASTPHDQKKAPGTGNAYYWGSNYGADASGDLDVVAPTCCYTTDIQGPAGYVVGDYVDSFGGTSCSCPNAAGVAALVLSANISQTRLQVTSNLLRGCDKIDNVSYSKPKAYGNWNDYFGYGRVNAYNSVRLAMGADVTPPTINHKNISSVSSTYPTVISAEIFDQDGSPVPSAGINQPVLFFRLNKNNAGWSAFDSLNSFSFSGNNYTFKIPCQGFETQVQYYIRARDNSGNTSTFPRGAPNAFWLCYFAVGTFATSSNTIGAFTATDGGASYSPTISFGNFPILNTRVQIYLNHSYISNEIIELYSPLANSSNNRKCLFSFNGGDGANIIGAIVADSATQFWSSGTPPYTNGLFKGDYLLNGFNGASANGNWKILNYDPYPGDIPYFDSVKISFTKTSGLLSPSAGLNSANDSVINFGTINEGDSVIKNFYLKNKGTSNLIAGSVTFTGTFASKFSLVSSPAGPIAPIDSGLFRVKLNSNIMMRAASVTENTDAFQNAVMNISLNDPSKLNFKVSLQSDNILPSLKHLTLKAVLQGFYDSISNTMVQDTLRAYLRSISSPYLIADSSISYLSSSGDGSFIFHNVSNGINYYIELVHRNSIETWSSSPGQIFMNDSLIYDFTAASSRAYGNNMIQVDNSPVRFALYGGDVDRDGTVDISDLSVIENDASNFVSGYVQSDLNGDQFTDLGDLTIADNNAYNFTVKVTPP